VGPQDARVAPSLDDAAGLAHREVEQEALRDPLGEDRAVRQLVAGVDHAGIDHAGVDHDVARVDHDDIVVASVDHDVARVGHDDIVVARVDDGLWHARVDDVAATGDVVTRADWRGAAAGRTAGKNKK
jgi:hypothetical protein